jgi:non-canonical (house-cleaning) NTP pyrophosphatase
MIKIALGSSSPHKVTANKIAIAWLKEKFSYLKFKFKYDDVDTGVSKQPLYHNEIMLGATNKAWNIYEKYLDSNYTLRVESGLFETQKPKSVTYKVYDVAAIRLLKHLPNQTISWKAWSSGIEIPIEFYEKFLEDRQSDPDITLGQSMAKSGIDFCSTDLTSYLTNGLISRSDLLIDPIKLVFAQAFKSEKMK